MSSINITGLDLGYKQHNIRHEKTAELRTRMRQIAQENKHGH